MHESFRMHRASNREGLYMDYNRIAYTLPQDLLAAAQQGELDMVKAYIADRFSARDKEGRTALCLAAENGHTDVVELDALCPSRPSCSVCVMHICGHMVV